MSNVRKENPTPKLEMLNYKKLQNLCNFERDKNFYLNYKYRGETKNYLDKFSTKLGHIENDPFIGFIGKNYTKKICKVVFLGRSGGESALSHHYTDKQLHKEFLEFKYSKGNLKSSYRKYAEAHKTAIENWNIFIYVKSFLFHTDLKLDDVAFVNTVPFRYKGKPRKKVVEVAFQNFTDELLSILRPNLIIPLGSKDMWTIPISALEFPHTVMSGIPRTNGDTWIDGRASEEIKRCVKQYKDKAKPRLKVIK